MKSLFKIVLLLLLSPIAWGQQGFEKVYLFGDTLSRFSSVYATDSCIYFNASTGNNTNRMNHHFGKLDLMGNVIQSYQYHIDTLYQYTGYTHTEMNLNFRGNFVFGYLNYGNGNSNTPRILEQKPSGEIVMDTLYSTLWNTDSLFFYVLPQPPELAVLADSTYLFAASYADLLTDDNLSQSFNGEAGTMVFKIDSNGTIIWQKRFRFEPTGLNKPVHHFVDIKQHQDNSFTLLLTQAAITPPDFDSDDYAKNYFIQCDANGNEISRDTFQDTQYCYGTPGYHELQDGSSIFGYLDSYTFGQQPDQDETNVRPVIARLDSEHQLIWKTPMADEYYSAVGESISFHDFIVKSDGLIAATMYFKILTLPQQLALLQIHKLSLDGEKLWKREYAYFVGDSINDGEYFIKDIDSTFDGGYLFAGYASKWDDFQGNKPYQYSYLLKTNCLGFIGAPQAAASVASSSTDSVVFVNHSIQAGSYTWLFGDGQTMTTTEYVNTVVHAYAQTGTYTITLIAHGCNSENDTLIFQHTIADTIPSYHGDGTLITVFPNPLISGNELSVYIGNIDSPAELILVDENGKTVYRQNEIVANTTYFLPTHQLATATYYIKLVLSSGKIESEKVQLHKL